jgi:activator of HSP90 ATPase
MPDTERLEFGLRSNYLLFSKYRYAHKQLRIKEYRMAQIEQTYTINAPVGEVYRAFTDARTAEQWGASPAKVDAQEGGMFSYWGGDIHGTYTKLVPNERIEQDWYGHDNPTWKYTVLLKFESNDASTMVHMIFAGNIVDEQKDRKDWQDYYFDPIKKLCEHSTAK